MCRLFGLHAGKEPTSATFWLLDAPDSLSEQSRREPDGAGIGVFAPDGRATVDKQPLAAYEDPAFSRAAHDLRGTTFLAHVRYASTGKLSVENTHPFLLDGRLFAHNGAFEGLDLLDARLAELGASDLVHGDTDSERMFALITVETTRHGGDVSTGLTAAVTWIARELPVYSLNLILTDATDMWALRYPEGNELHVLERPAGSALDAASQRIHARSDGDAAACVIVASEPMDDETGWRLLDPGELIHIDSALTVTASRPFPDRLGHPLTLQDMGSAATSSQQA
jgi:predicted glutamine amidotransferase